MSQNPFDRLRFYDRTKRPQLTDPEVDDLYDKNRNLIEALTTRHDSEMTAVEGRVTILETDNVIVNTLFNALDNISGVVDALAYTTDGYWETTTAGAITGADRYYLYPSVTEATNTHSYVVEAAGKSTTQFTWFAQVETRDSGGSWTANGTEKSLIITSAGTDQEGVLTLDDHTIFATKQYRISLRRTGTLGGVGAYSRITNLYGLVTV